MLRILPLFLVCFVVACGPGVASNPAQMADTALDCEALRAGHFEICVADLLDADASIPEDLALAYCACVIDRAIESFGCAGVASHESVDDATWEQHYLPLIDACGDAVFGPPEDEGVEPYFDDGDEAVEEGEPGPEAELSSEDDPGEASEADGDEEK